MSKDNNQKPIENKDNVSENSESRSKTPISFLSDISNINWPFLVNTPRSTTAVNSSETPIDLSTLTLNSSTELKSPRFSLSVNTNKTEEEEYEDYSQAHARVSNRYFQYKVISKANQRLNNDDLLMDYIKKSDCFKLEGDINLVKDAAKRAIKIGKLESLGALITSYRRGNDIICFTDEEIEKNHFLQKVFQDIGYKEAKISQIASAIQNNWLEINKHRIADTTKLSDSEQSEINNLLFSIIGPKDPHNPESPNYNQAIAKERRLSQPIAFIPNAEEIEILQDISNIQQHSTKKPEPKKFEHSVGSFFKELINKPSFFWR